MYRDIESKWDFDKKEKQFIDYCFDRNYEIIQCKQFTTKTKWKFRVSEKIEIEWETLNDSVKLYEHIIDNYIRQTLELEELKKKWKELQSDQ